MEEVDIKTMQAAQLEILRELKRVCDANGINYYLAFGTCLGAVRHKGFIPWDDDVDVLMFYDDVQKLMKVRKQFKSNFFLQSKGTDPEFDCSLLRLRNSNTTCIEKEEVGLDINHGVFVDIYPLYYAPKSKWGLTVNIWRSWLYRLLIAERVPYNHGKMMKIISSVVLGLFKGEARKKQINNFKRALCNPKDNGYVLDYYGLDVTLFSATCYPSECFRKPAEIMFEGELFKAPTDPDLFLKTRYGDYMKLPPEEKQVPHHSYVFADVEKAYTTYRDIYMGE